MNRLKQEFDFGNNKPKDQQSIDPELEKQFAESFQNIKGR